MFTKTCCKQEVSPAIADLKAVLILSTSEEFAIIEQLHSVAESHFYAGISALA